VNWRHVLIGAFTLGVLLGFGAYFLERSRRDG